MKKSTRKLNKVLLTSLNKGNTGGRFSRIITRLRLIADKSKIKENIVRVTAMFLALLF